MKDSLIGTISISVGLCVKCVFTTSICCVSIFVTFFSLVWKSTKPHNISHSGNPSSIKSGLLGGSQPSPFAFESR